MIRILPSIALAGLALTMNLAAQTESAQETPAPTPVLTAADIARQSTILTKPLRNDSQLKLPRIPEGFRWSIVSTSPAGIIANDGKITRPAKDTPVAVTLKLENEKDPADTAGMVLTVPIDKPYVAPVVNEDKVQAAKDRYERQKYGLFVHYVPGLTADTNGQRLDIDTLSQTFDAAQFAQDAADFGVEYVIFTVMHLKARMLYPSEANKRWRDERRMPVEEGKKPESKSYADDDLIDRLATELAKRNIDLHLYVHPVDGHDFSKEDQEITGWNDCDVTKDDHERWNDFQNELFDELVKRYQGRIKGLWFDGMFRHSTKKPGHNMIDQERFRETLLAYDPTLVLVANVASDRRPDPSPEWRAADYRAYEVSRVRDGGLGFVGINRDATEEDSSTWPATRNQIAMIIASNWWAQNKKSMVRQTPENLFRYIVHQASLSTHGGFAMSAGCFPGTAAENTNGNIWEGDFHPTMLRINELIKPVAIAVKDTRPGKAYTTKEREWFGQREWGVSTESPDGKTIYLHVMIPPAGQTLKLGPTEDGSELTGPATLVATGKPVSLKKTAAGYEITLPAGTAWDPLNTVIAVRRR